jgi:hypothetical protein
VVVAVQVLPHQYRLLNEQAGLFSLLIRLGEQANEQAKPSYTIC